MRILMILIPGNQAKPLLKVGQVTEPYYVFRDSGAEVVFASPSGGAPVPTTTDHDCATAVRHLRADQPVLEALADTLCINQVSADDFQAAFCIGAIEEINAASDHPVSLVIAQLLDAGKPVAMLSDRDGVRLLITGNAPRPAAQALLGALSNETIPR
jgi:putative intracellular protease/amidase